MFVNDLFRQFVSRGSMSGNTPFAQDHDNAAALANGLGALPGIRAQRSPGATNAVYFQVSHGPSSSERCMICHTAEDENTSCVGTVFSDEGHVHVVLPAAGSGAIKGLFCVVRPPRPYHWLHAFVRAAFVRTDYGAAVACAHSLSLLVMLQVIGMDAQAFVDSLKRDHGVLMGSGYFGGNTIRAMTHLDVDREGVERAIEASRAVLAEGSGKNDGSK